MKPKSNNGLIIGLFVCAIATGFYWWYSVGELSAAQVNFDKAKNGIQDFNAIADDVVELQQRKKALPPNIDKINRNSTIAFIERHAIMSGVGRPAKITPSPLRLVDKTNNISELNIRILSNEVYLAQVTKFMYNLESGGLGLKVASLKLTPGRKDPKKWVIDFKVSSFLQISE